MKKIIVLSIFIIGITACTGTRSSSSLSDNETKSSKTERGIDVNESDLAKLRYDYPKATLDQLNQGKDLFVSNCNLCHKLSYSYGLSRKKVRRLVPKMCNKVNRKLGEKVINKEGKESILMYLYAVNSKRINFQSK